ncbi:MAG TPA: SDR family NAD(P)-dependent oxidoreductase [Roseiarcus sp.]|jgi:NAD(P)-dependent dehydrogenase (short-subunit alcohol dehydrogenase family)
MKGRVIVVTGAYGALGRVTVGLAFRSGHVVAALDASSEPPEGLVGQMGASGVLLGGTDLLRPEEAKRAMTEVATRCGRIDALVNLAGGFASETVEEGDAASWRRLYDLNVTTTLNATKAALPHLLASSAGRIVNVGAGAAVRATHGMGAYGASKAAVLRLTESLADEMKLRNVTVNAVLPSIIDTPANRAAMPKADFSRWVAPEDLAAVILFLASEAARAVTGALIPVNGRL